jgi:hypothetical protein
MTGLNKGRAGVFSTSVANKIPSFIAVSNTQYTVLYFIPLVYSSTEAHALFSSIYE